MDNNTDTYAEWEARMREQHTCADKEERGRCNHAFND